MNKIDLIAVIIAALLISGCSSNMDLWRAQAEANQKNYEVLELIFKRIGLTTELVKTKYEINAMRIKVLELRINRLED